MTTDAPTPTPSDGSSSSAGPTSPVESAPSGGASVPSGGASASGREERSTSVRPGALTPYLTVDDARRALDWYVEVFAATRRGEPVTMPDGRIGHAELTVAGAVLMLADESPDLGLLGPRARGGPSQSLVLEVADVDATVRRAVAAGALLSRPAADNPHGRNAVVVDPFGHRWLVSSP